MWVRAQAWTEQYTRTLERLPNKRELQDGLDAVVAVAKQVCAHSARAVAPKQGITSVTRPHRPSVRWACFCVLWQLNKRRACVHLRAGPPAGLH